jgi:hypothetical protein
MSDLEGQAGNSGQFEVVIGRLMVWVCSYDDCESVNAYTLRVSWREKE